MKTLKRIISIILVVTFLFNFNMAIYAKQEVDLERVINEVADYLVKTVPEPTVGSVGGEWIIIGLARSNYDVPKDYYNKYYMNLETYLKANEGILHSKKYTEYSRVVLALTAIGKNPENVSGYNLLMPLGDFEQTKFQGLNGPVFALIALDSGDYEMPINKKAKTQATRQMYVDEIVKRQLPDGGFGLTSKESNPDITGMALQALSNYQDQKSVEEAIDKALVYLANEQNQRAGYESEGVESVESSAQVLMGLCAMKIDTEIKEFTKSNKTILDNIMLFYVSGSGFRHTLDGDVEGMSTEQAFCGLVNYQRIKAGKTSLYDMSDIKGSKKEKDVKEENTDSLYYFSDIENSPYRNEIETLAILNILSGKSEGKFEPESTINRAEFATIVVKALDIKPKEVNVFKDVEENSWYAPYVGAAYSEGIVNGVSEVKFSPLAEITKEEAAVMLTNASKYLGINTYVGNSESKEILSKFSDTEKTASWAKLQIAFCYKQNIFSSSDKNIDHKKRLTRGEMAYMVFNMIKLANKAPNKE